MVKSLKDISWLVTEEEYRADPAISYSTLAKFEREGFNRLSSLFDRIDTPSLTLGSCVDSIVTGGMREFNDRFFVSDIGEVSDAQMRVLNVIKSRLPDDWTGTLDNVPNSDIEDATQIAGYQLNWKPSTRVTKIRQDGTQYFNMLMLSQGKTVISNELFNKVLSCVEALKTSKATGWYFQDDNPFENVERLYQLKFKGDYNGIPVRIMADLIVVDHDAKVLYFTDLKTSSHTEWEFPKSFIEWRYMYQAGLYSYVVQQNMLKDPYFKDFKLMPYRFIVVNKETVEPLVWEFGQTFSEDDFILGNYKVRNWRKALVELNHYLKDSPRVPDGIYLDKPNSIEDYFKNE